MSNSFRDIEDTLLDIRKNVQQLSTQEIERLFNALADTMRDLEKELATREEIEES